MNLGRQPARDIIAESGRTITGLADEMGVSFTHFRGTLHGYITPRRVVREKLPKILGVPLEELYTPELLAKRYTGTRPGRLGMRKAVAE